MDSTAFPPGVVILCVLLVLAVRAWYYAAAEVDHHRKVEQAAWERRRQEAAEHVKDREQARGPCGHFGHANGCPQKAKTPAGYIDDDEGRFVDVPWTADEETWRRERERNRKVLG